MVGQQRHTQKVVGDDVIMVNPTIIRGDGRSAPYMLSSERTPYDVYSVLSEDKYPSVRQNTPRRIVGLTTKSSSPRTPLPSNKNSNTPDTLK